MATLGVALLNHNDVETLDNSVAYYLGHLIVCILIWSDLTDFTSSAHNIA